MCCCVRLTMGLSKILCYVSYQHLALPCISPSPCLLCYCLLVLVMPFALSCLVLCPIVLGSLVWLCTERSHCAEAVSVPFIWYSNNLLCLTHSCIHDLLKYLCITMVECNRFFFSASIGEFFFQCFYGGKIGLEYFLSGPFPALDGWRR